MEIHLLQKIFLKIEYLFYFEILRFEEMWNFNGRERNKRFLNFVF